MSAQSTRQRITVGTQDIFGLSLDQQGRCQHWHSPVDIVANKCALCQQFYACFKCHDELETHTFQPVPPSQSETVLCGSCGRKFSYLEYQKLNKCSSCQHQFNPRCALHANIYCD